MHLFYQPQAVDFLSEEDSRHAIKILRLGVGDTLFVTNGRGIRQEARISKADARRCTYRVVAEEQTPARPFAIRVCVAPTKNLDRIEWLVEKAVELGIERISFFFGQHSERRVLKLDRLEKIAIAAMKQSLQSWLPVLDEALPFGQLLPTIQETQRFIAHLPPEKPPGHLYRAATINNTYAVLIGPEGDFSPTELMQAQQAGFVPVTLGPNRLRTETAALAACQMLNLVNAEL